MIKIGWGTEEMAQGTGAFALHGERPWLDLGYCMTLSTCQEYTLCIALGEAPHNMEVVPKQKQLGGKVIKQMES